MDLIGTKRTLQPLYFIAFNNKSIGELDFLETIKKVFQSNYSTIPNIEVVDNADTCKKIFIDPLIYQKSTFA